MKDRTKRVMADAIEHIEEILVILFFALLAWLYLMATPDQSSAECDALQDEIAARQ